MFIAGSKAKRNFIAIAGVLLLISVILFSVVGCGGGSSNNQGGTPSGGGSTAKISFRIDNPTAAGSPFEAGIFKFVELLEQKTDGRATAQVYSGAILTNNDASQSMHILRSGDVEAGFLMQGFFAQIEPRWSIFAMPFLYENTEQAFEIWDGEAGQYMLDLLPELGYEGLAYFLSGRSVITNSVRPVVTPDDLTGLKIRCPDSPLNLTITSALGAYPVAMAMGEIFLALQQGVIDGQFNSLMSIDNRGFYEVQDYLTMTEHELVQNVFAMNKKYFDSLPADIQTAIREAAIEASIYQRKLVLDAEAGYLKKFADDYSMQIRYLTPAEKQVWIAKAQPVYDEYTSKIGEEVMNLFYKALGR